MVVRRSEFPLIVVFILHIILSERLPTGLWRGFQPPCCCFEVKSVVVVVVEVGLVGHGRGGEAEGEVGVLCGIPGVLSMAEGEGGMVTAVDMVVEVVVEEVKDMVWMVGTAVDMVVEMVGTAVAMELLVVVEVM